MPETPTCINSQKLLTFADVAARLGVAPVTVRRYSSQGKIGHLKIGGLVRFRENHVKDFVKEIQPAQ